jgi:putative ABC transport system substrate-binding protein
VDRRAFIAVLGGAAAWPTLAWGIKQRPLIAGLSSVTKQQLAPLIGAFMEGMRDFGWKEGDNFDIIIRVADNELNQLPVFADELLRANPDLMVAFDPPSISAVHDVTRSLPIVSALLTDPVGMRLVASYSHPGGNLTGMVVAVEGLSTKQVELPAELIPGLTTLGVVVNPTNATSGHQLQEIETAATASGIRIVAAEVRAEPDLKAAFQALASKKVQGVIGIRDGLLLTNAAHVGQLAITYHLPSIFGLREQVVAGGMIGYGVNLMGNYRRTAYFVDRILKGTHPGDLPLEFPTRVELIVNLKTAKSLGIPIPSSLLARADEVIE